MSKIILPIIGHVDLVEVYAYKSLFVIDSSSIPDEAERLAYKNWLSRQTCPVIEEIPDASYARDYIRFHTAYVKGDSNPLVYD